MGSRGRFRAGSTRRTHVTDIKTYALLSEDVYSDEELSPQGWRRQLWRADAACGFFGAVYQTGQCTVVAFRGSQDRKDFLDADLDIALRSVPLKQMEAAVNLFNVARTVASEAITLTGHSLGGGLAQVVACYGKVRAVTFNAPGVKSQWKSHCKLNPQNSVPGDAWLNSSIVNVRVRKDAVRAGTGEHLGSVHTIQLNKPLPLKIPGPFLDVIVEAVESGQAHLMKPLREYMETHPLGNADPWTNTNWDS